MNVNERLWPMNVQRALINDHALEDMNFQSSTLNNKTTIFNTQVFIDTCSYLALVVLLALNPAMTMPDSVSFRFEK